MMGIAAKVLKIYLFDQINSKSWTSGTSLGIIYISYIALSALGRLNKNDMAYI
jgi:hypothetical protein